MKKLCVTTMLFTIVGCGSGTNTNNMNDSIAKHPAGGGNSDGSNTIGADTTHIDTSLGKVKSDSLR